MGAGDLKDVEVLVVGWLPDLTVQRLAAAFTIHRAADAKDIPAAIAGESGKRIRAIATHLGIAIGEPLFAQLPRLEIVSRFGVGYDGVDVHAAAKRGVIVTNTPDVLTEEVADTAIGLLLMTVRELSSAERFLRAGKWETGEFPMSRLTLRDRTAGILGLGRIGMAIARRLDAMRIPVAYHNRAPRTDVSYRYYDTLHAMAAAVDTLIVVVPGGRETRHLVDASILRALGRDGVVINIGRGPTVEEAALITALRDGTIAAAGLDVFEHEPHVPTELMSLPNAVLLPHVASASTHTRNAMGNLVVDNLLSWFADGKPLTPVKETPFPPR